MFRNILIATDASELAGHAVANGLTLAKATGAKVLIILVEAPMHSDIVKQESSAALQHAAEQARIFGVPCDTIHVEHDRPDQAIIEAADANGCDLIVMGTHGRGGLSTALLGSVTHDLLRSTRKPVLVWP
jgi:nucleotide-binding universal stress UspA family protein